MKRRSDKGAPFPLLRAAYLRAIARVWREPRVLEELLELSKNEPRGVLDRFEQDFGFEFPFPKVKLVLSENNRPRWEPVGTRGWFGFADAYRVTLPKKPDKQDEEVELLAEYMQQFPSLLGRAKEDSTEAPDDFASFGLVTGRVIALAWHSDDFRQKLFGTEDARELVQNAMDVMVPWNFCLKFKEYDVPKLSNGDGDGLSAMRFDFEHFPPTEIVLNVPTRPSEEQHHAIALAAYNHTGRQYPFTCG